MSNYTYPRPNMQKEFALKLAYDPDRALLADYPVDIVVFYEMYFRHARYIEVQDTFIADVQSAANSVWYELGLYEKYGKDYFDQTYTPDEDDATYYQTVNYLAFVLQQDQINLERAIDRQ